MNKCENVDLNFRFLLFFAEHNCVVCIVCFLLYCLLTLLPVDFVIFVPEKLRFLLPIFPDRRVRPEPFMSKNFWAFFCEMFMKMTLILIIPHSVNVCLFESVLPPINIFAIMNYSIISIVGDIMYPMRMCCFCLWNSHVFSSYFEILCTPF